MTDIRVGLIGSGYIGKTHAIAYSTHQSVFGGTHKFKRQCLAEIDQQTADTAAAKLGFERGEGNWHALVEADDIDVVAIATPNALHKEMAIAAIKAGKHVYVEKPLALDTVEANSILAVLEASPKPLVHMLGYNYVCNPIINLAREIIESGELGDIVHFRGRHNEDYMANPNVPFSWRCSKAASGTGTIGDMGSHIISMAMYLLGPIEALIGDIETVIKERRTVGGSMKPVENEDQAHALMRFKNGTMGALETSRIATGYKQGLAFEITGSKACLEFNQERMNELRLYEADAPDGRRGFKTILVDKNCADYAPFCPAPGHGLGYNDLKVIEVQKLMQAITVGTPVPVDLYTGRDIEMVIDSWVTSAETRSWIDIGS